MEQGSSKRGALFLVKRLKTFAKVVYFSYGWYIIEVDRGYKTSTKTHRRWLRWQNEIIKLQDAYLKT